MSDSLTVQQPKTPVLAGDRGVRFNDMNDMWKFCCHVVNSNQIKDISTPEIALIRLQAGMELGLSPIWSLTNIMVTNGRPSVWGDGLLGIVRAHPLCEDVIETIEGEGDKAAATCEVRRKGCVPVVRRFSVPDAKKAGLWGKSGPWTNYPTRMLAMRARSWACRDAFADALRGLGVREELQELAPREVRGRVVETKLILPGDPIADIPNETSEAVATHGESAQSGVVEAASSGTTQSEPSLASAAKGLVSGESTTPHLDPVNAAGEFTWEAE